MRAVEYININHSSLKHADILSQVIKDLLPLRSDPDVTSENANTHLSAEHSLSACLHSLRA